MSESDITQAIEIKTRHEAALLALPGVVGVGVGLLPPGHPQGGRLAIVVLVRGGPPQGLPPQLEGFPVDVVEAGDIEALADGRAG